MDRHVSGPGPLPPTSGLALVGSWSLLCLVQLIKAWFWAWPWAWGLGWAGWACFSVNNHCQHGNLEKIFDLLYESRAAQALLWRAALGWSRVPGQPDHYYPFLFHFYIINSCYDSNNDSVTTYLYNTITHYYVFKHMLLHHYYLLLL